MPEKLIPFDASAYLDNEETVVEYLNAAFDQDDPNLMLAAIGDVAKVHGMAQIARDTGLGRESLYKALQPGAKPRFDTVMKVMKALGVKLHVEPARTA